MDYEVNGLERNLPLHWALRVRPEALAKLTLKVKLFPQGFFKGTGLLLLDDHFLVNLSQSLPPLGATLSDEVTGITIDVAGPEVGRLGNSSVPENTLSPICIVASRPMESRCFQSTLGLVQNVSKKLRKQPWLHPTI